MKKRLLGAFIVLFILITSLLLGNTVFSITMTVVSLLGLRELIDIKYKKRFLLYETWRYQKYII